MGKDNLLIMGQRGKSTRANVEVTDSRLASPLVGEAAPTRDHFASAAIVLGIVSNAERRAVFAEVPLQFKRVQPCRAEPHHACRALV
jgi:hypothetical protein